MSTIQSTLIDLLATLRAIQWHAWNTHWKAQGGDAYSDHLLFQRIYTGDGGGPKIDDQIDGLGERIIALFGNDAVDGVEIGRKATAIHSKIKGVGMVAGALKLEQKALKLASKAADQAAKGADAIRISLDNFVRELADARSTVVYLLQQRLKGGAQDNFGAFGALGEQVSLSTLLPFVVGGTAVGALATGADPDDTPVAGAKLGAAAGLAMGLIWLSNSTESQEGEATAALSNPDPFDLILRHSDRFLLLGLGAAAFGLGWAHYKSS